MGATLRGGDGVAVGIKESVLIQRPGDGPLNFTGTAVEFAASGEGHRGQCLALIQLGD